MLSITGGGRGGLFSVHRGALWWLRRCHSPLFSSLAGGGGRGDAPHLPVLIVGAGPVGLVLSFLLTKFGIKCAVIEKNVEFTRHPRAHFINNRTMEIFRKLDGLAGDIERSQPPVDLWRKFVYCTSLSSSVLGSVDHMKQEDFDKVISPISVAHFSQYKLVELLLKKLEGIGFRTCFPGDIGNSTQDLVLESKILMGHECTSLQQTDEGILVGVSANNVGRIIERKLHCGLLLGTDGARSTVRELAGISMEGERDLQKLVSVHFLSRDLGRYLSSQRPGDEDIATLDTLTPWSSPSSNSFPTQLPRRPRIQQTRRHCFGHNFLIRHRNGPFLDALERGRRRRRFGSGPSSRRSVDHSV